jgi:hypothetical protein
MSRSVSENFIKVLYLLASRLPVTLLLPMLLLVTKSSKLNNQVTSTMQLMCLRGGFPDGAAAPLHAGDDEHVGEEEQHALLAAAGDGRRHRVVSEIYTI